MPNNQIFSNYLLRSCNKIYACAVLKSKRILFTNANNFRGNRYKTSDLNQVYVTRTYLYLFDYSKKKKEKNRPKHSHILPISTSSRVSLDVILRNQLGYDYKLVPFGEGRK